jgi:hypothetical protein
MGVDDGPPVAAHAPAAREGRRWETSQDVEEKIVGETDRFVVAVARVHRDGFGTIAQFVLDSANPARFRFSLFFSTESLLCTVGPGCYDFHDKRHQEFSVYTN